MGLIIGEDVLLNAKMSPDDLLIEIAVHLYDIGRLTLGQARNMAGLDQISFQLEMSKRDVLIKYEYEDFLDDLDSIKAYKEMKE
ncbi:MAG: UPF0175 family protein [Lewinella sp.]|jgi:predicted HTH domain antitoxin|uniref:UPF0175 family protein n=1 Tax=Lewinella sp. TaxID=2004506 RepID=UPI003D6A786F